MFYLPHTVHSPLPFYLESEHKVLFPGSLENSEDIDNSPAWHTISGSPGVGGLSASQLTPLCRLGRPVGFTTKRLEGRPLPG